MQTFIVDSFTDEPFSGNPAGVCLVDRHVSDDTMLSIAQELGLSENAFVRPGDSDSDWSIRFFSPLMEIPLCGHATLAAAKVLFEDRSRSSVTFVNKDTLELAAANVSGQIVMEFPRYTTRPCKAPPALFEALGISDVKNVVYNEETKILLLEVESVAAVAALEPDFLALRRSHESINGVLVTAASPNTT